MNLDYNSLHIASIIIIGVTILYITYMTYKDITEAIRLRSLDQRLKKAGILEEIEKKKVKRKIPVLKVKQKKEKVVKKEKKEKK